MIDIQIEDLFLNQIPEELLVTTAEAALRQQGALENSEISIVITGDAEIQQYNRQYLGHDAPTDVLSFPSGDEFDPDSGNPYLGDILISLPRAQAQALAGGHSPDSEIQLLVVHGVLHLMGHDHAEPDERAAMWRAQAEILSGLNNPLANLP